MALLDVKYKSQEGGLWRVVADVDGVKHILFVTDDANLDAQVLAIAEAAARVVTLGAREVKTPPPPPGPTQDEIDKAAFISLCQDYAAKRAQVDAAIGKATQADVDAAVAAVKAAYIDAYAPILARFF